MTERISRVVDRVLYSLTPRLQCPWPWKDNVNAFALAEEAHAEQPAAHAEARRAIDQGCVEVHAERDMAVKVVGVVCLGAWMPRPCRGEDKLWPPTPVVLSRQYENGTVRPVLIIGIPDAAKNQLSAGLDGGHDVGGHAVEMDVSKGAAALASIGVDIKMPGKMVGKSDMVLLAEVVN